MEGNALTYGLINALSGYMDAKKQADEQSALTQFLSPTVGRIGLPGQETIGQNNTQFGMGSIGMPQSLPTLPPISEIPSTMKNKLSLISKLSPDLQKEAMAAIFKQQFPDPIGMAYTQAKINNLDARTQGAMTKVEGGIKSSSIPSLSPGKDMQWIPTGIYPDGEKRWVAKAIPKQNAGITNNMFNAAPPTM